MKKTVRDQQFHKRIRKLDTAILRAYAYMAAHQLEDVGEYFAPIDELIEEIQLVIVNTDICDIVANLGIYAFVCAAHEHWNGVREINGETIKADKNIENFGAALDDLDDAGWPCPGHIQFWDWVTELRRRTKYWDNGSENKTPFQLNTWEWIINWDDLSWDEGFDIIETDDLKFVTGYLDDGTPIYIERKYDMWVAGRFGNASWRERETISTGWRNPFAASFALYREPNYPGAADWYNGPGTEIIPDEDDDD